MIATITLMILAATVGLWITTPLIAAALMADLGAYAIAYMVLR